MKMTGALQTKSSIKMQCLGDLWGTLRNIICHVDNDNCNSEEYPIYTRAAQTASIAAVLREIEHCHSKINKIKE